MTKRLKKFRIWEAEAVDNMVVPCRNRYGSFAHFENYKEGVVLIGFGEEGGCEPDKDAMKIDKEDLPKIIEFLQKCL